jgi:hypothetical protein
MIVDALTSRERVLDDMTVVEALSPLPAATVDKRYDYSIRGPYLYPPERYWSTLWMQYNFYEYPTTELIDGICDHLAPRIPDYTGVDETARILDIAAGTGVIGYWIDKGLSRRGIDVQTALVDDFSWNWPRTQYSIAQEMDGLSALTRFKPHVVLGCWLPSEQDIDWTRNFRALPSVQEYVLVGEAERHGAASAWGIEYDSTSWQRTRLQEAQFQIDGFMREDMTALYGLQRCYNISNNANPTLSSTVSFRRVSQNNV